MATKHQEGHVMLGHLVLGRAMMQVDHVDLRGAAGDHGVRAGIVSRLVNRCASACAALAQRPAQRRARVA